MANQQTSQNAEDTFGFTPKQMQFLQVLIDQMKKPYIDPDVESRKETARQRLRQQRDEAAHNIAASQEACTHLREDNTSRVAWAEYLHKARNLYIKEGYCQACNKHFHPGVEGYAQMLRVPTRAAGVII